MKPPAQESAIPPAARLRERVREGRKSPLNRRRASAEQDRARSCPVCALPVLAAGRIWGFMRCSEQVGSFGSNFSQGEREKCVRKENN